MIEALPTYVLTMIVLKKQVSQARRQNNKLRLQSGQQSSAEGCPDR